MEYLIPWLVLLLVALVGLCYVLAAWLKMALGRLDRRPAAEYVLYFENEDDMIGFTREAWSDLEHDLVARNGDAR